MLTYWYTLRGDIVEGFSGLYTSLALSPSSSIGPQVFSQGQEERQGPKGSVDLNQYVCLDDTG